MDAYILDEDKNPVRVEMASKEYREFNSDFDNKRVGQDTIGDATVSTVFLGLDHRFDEGRPVLFETMVFGGDLDMEMERYCTWDEAVEGHREMVRRIKEANQ